MGERNSDLAFQLVNRLIVYQTFKDLNNLNANLIRASSFAKIKFKDFCYKDYIYSLDNSTQQSLGRACLGAPSAELLNLRILRFPPFNNFELIHTLTGSSKAWLHHFPWSKDCEHNTGQSTHL
ncbi:hypothetical protein RIR_jg21005.t1 [Rhizophagus irregularis DAOM 181602=DAOM 197198]|nr:hypothetical protein RIR_jg21005.t1 [Rhizophagus irregularis DAOM 181602=DAOM 197198]